MVEETTLAFRVLELVALLLPALGIYFKFFLENDAPRTDFEPGNIYHDLTTSAWMFLAIGGVLVAGITACIILVYNDNAFISIVGFMLSSSFLVIFHMTHEWYISNVRDMKGSLESAIEDFEETKSMMDLLEREIQNMNIEDMSYLEKRKEFNKYKEIAEDLAQFEAETYDSVEELVMGLSSRIPERKQELETAVSEAEELKDDVHLLPNKESLEHTLRNPGEYLKNGSLLVPWLVFWIFSKALRVGTRIYLFTLTLLFIVIIYRIINGRRSEKEGPEVN